MALPKRRDPRRADEGAPSAAFTRTPMMAGSTRCTNDGSEERWAGWGARSRAVGTAKASAGTSTAVSTQAASRRLMTPPGWMECGSAAAVLSLVIGAKLARLQRAPPRFVLAVPRHRRRERGREGVARRPAELRDLGAVHRVAAIVTRSIGDGADQTLRPARETQDLPGEHDVLDLLAAADVVDLAVAPPAQDEVEGGAIVEHVEPIAHVAPVAVER